MTSQLNVDTIADKAGTGPVGLTKQSAAKVWGMIDGTGTVAYRDSFGTSALLILQLGFTLYFRLR